MIKHGAKAEQLHIKTLGEAHGPDNTRDQNHRVVLWLRFILLMPIVPDLK